MSEAPPREWRFYVSDMVDFCNKVLAYMQGLDRADFSAGSMRHDAVLRNLALIGEARRPRCSPLSPSCPQSLPTPATPW